MFYLGQPLGRTDPRTRKKINRSNEPISRRTSRSNNTAARMILSVQVGRPRRARPTRRETNFLAASVAQSRHPKIDLVGARGGRPDDTMAHINFAFAVEGVGWGSPDYFRFSCSSPCSATGTGSFGASPPPPPACPSHIISANSLANSYMSVSTS